MAKAKRRRMRKRKPVNRGDRVEATPETIAKLRPDYLQHLLARDGIDHQEVEALLAIEQAWHTIERQFGAHRGYAVVPVETLVAPNEMETWLRVLPHPQAGNSDLRYLHSLSIFRNAMLAAAK